MATEEEDLWHALLNAGDGGAREVDFYREAKPAANRDVGRFVTFRVGTEVYGLPIRVIDQILKRIDVPTTAVPRTPPFLVGIGNVKGTVMPIVDLAKRLGLPEEKMTRTARILVVRHEGELHGIEVGLVLGVCPMPRDSMEEAPGAIGRSKVDFIDCLGRYEDQTVILLNLDSLLNPQDFVLPRFRRDARDPVVA